MGSRASEIFPVQRHADKHFFLNCTDAMDVAAAVAGIQPLGGQVVPIRTVQETRPPEEFGT